jgi:hypothetical protein
MRPIRLSRAIAVLLAVAVPLVAWLPTPQAAAQAVWRGHFDDGLVTKVQRRSPGPTYQPPPPYRPPPPPPPAYRPAPPAYRPPPPVSKPVTGPALRPANPSVGISAIRRTPLAGPSLRVGGTGLPSALRSPVTNLRFRPGPMFRNVGALRDRPVYVHKTAAAASAARRAGVRSSAAIVGIAAVSAAAKHGSQARSAPANDNAPPPGVGGHSKGASWHRQQWTATP